MRLREYQESVVVSAFESLNNGECPLVVAPTGSGKMVIIAALAVNAECNVLIIEHRIELVEQALEKLQKFGINVSVVVSGVRDKNPDSNIKVAMIHTVNNRELGDWVPDLIIIDEAHLSAAASYKRLIARFPVLRIGFTATPDRLDGRGFEDVFTQIICGPTIRELTNKGFLVPISNHIVFDVADLSTIKMSGNEFDQDEVATEMIKFTNEIVGEWYDRCGDRPSIFFASNVIHSRRICKRLNEIGVSAEHIDGTTPPGIRKSIIVRFKRGETQVISNCGVVIEGFDAPRASCVVLSIATYSLSKYLQCCGRGMRPDEESGKRDLVILDFGENKIRHGSVDEEREWTLEARPKQFRQREHVESSKEQKEPEKLTYIPGQWDYGVDNDVIVSEKQSKVREKPTGRVVQPIGNPPPFWLPENWYDWWYTLESFRLANRLPPSYSISTARKEYLKAVS